MAAPRGDRGRDLVRERASRRERCIDQVDAGAAVQAIARGIARVDLHQAAEAATVLRAVAARDELDRAHEIRVDHRAKAAEVIEQRHAHAVHVDARVLRRGAPHHDSPRARGGARDARQILDDLQHVTRRAGDAARLIGFDLGRHHLLGQRGRDDHDLEIVAVGVRVLFGRVELDLVGGVDLLAGLEALFALQRLQVAPRQRHAVLARLDAVDAQSGPLRR